MLSAFFWGYILTQIIGGYLSDRMGGTTVLTTAAIGWSLMTLMMPRIIKTFASHYWSMLIIVFSRILLGALQGKLPDSCMHAKEQEIINDMLNLIIICCKIDIQISKVKIFVVDILNIHITGK